MIAFITTVSVKGFEKIREFLRGEGVRHGFCKALMSKNGRQVYHLSFGSQKGLQTFVDSIFPYVILKRTHCEIMKEALDLRRGMWGNIRLQKESLDEFDVLRHRLHALALKGRELGEWT